jgi:hypothetical protein
MELRFIIQQAIIENLAVGVSESNPTRCLTILAPWFAVPFARAKKLWQSICNDANAGVLPDFIAPSTGTHGFDVAVDAVEACCDFKWIFHIHRDHEEVLDWPICHDAVEACCNSKWVLAS